MSDIPRIDAWIEKNLPLTYRTLNPKATRDQWQELVQVVGQNPSAGLQIFYTQYHNGQNIADSTACYMFNLPMLPIEEMIKQYKFWKDLKESQNEEDWNNLKSGSTSIPEGYIMKEYFSEGWIPFASDLGGNYLACDLTPDVRGEKGQIINFGRDEDEKFVIKSNFVDMIAYLNEQIVNNNVEIEDNHFYLKEPHNRHFLDALKLMYK